LQKKIRVKEFERVYEKDDDSGAILSIVVQQAAQIARLQTELECLKQRLGFQ